MTFTSTPSALLRRAASSTRSTLVTLPRRLGHWTVDRFPWLEPPLVMLWYWYVYLFVRTVGVVNSVRYEAAIDPFQLYWIDPDDVVRRQPPHPNEKYKYFGRVVDGDWDTGLDRFEETDPYRSFEAHFERGVPWEETAFFRRIVGEIKDGRTRWDCASPEEFVERCAALDDLYRRLDREGYRTQAELAAATDSEVIRKRRHSIVHRLIYDEMTVSVDRHGEFVFNDGRHRLAIAKLLDLDRVAVRIMVRHADWQRVRDAVATGAIDLDTQPAAIRDHPDLEGLQTPAADRSGR